MRILLVEDEIAVADEIERLLTSQCRAEVRTAHSRDSAQQLINDIQDFDLIVCDLKIPTTDRGLDLSVDHGLDVYRMARLQHSGTPCIFLSGFIELDNIGEELTAAPTVDLFGTGSPSPLVGWRRKSQIPEFVEQATLIAEQLQRVDNITLELSRSNPTNKYQTRPLRLYARQLGGTRIVASGLSGLSGATVYRGQIFDATQSRVGYVVAKVNVISEIQDEINRFNRYVASRLHATSFAPLASSLLHGSGRFGAAFYSVAPEGHSDLFELISDDICIAARAIPKLRAILDPWSGDVTVPTTIGDLRSKSVQNRHLEPFSDQLDRIYWQEIEAKRLPMTQATQHGDLHGRNVLIDGQGNPMIIDYGDVGTQPALLDPVTLELSFLFHQDHPQLGGWPTPRQALEWFNLPVYLRDSPVSDAIVACREWSASIGTDLELAAMVYVYSVRQLKYPDTNKALALRIAEAAANVLLAAA